MLLPFYAAGSSGWHVVWGATGGYLLGFTAAAATIGWLAEHGADRKVAVALLAFIAGQAVNFAFGLAGLKIAVGQSWSWTIHNGFTIFIIGGLIKALIAALVLPSAWHLVRRIQTDG